MPIIKSKKFILRPIRKDDAELVARYANDKTIAKNTMVPHPYTLKDAEDFIRKKIVENKKKKKENRVFAIEVNGKFAGVIGVHHILLEHKAEIGYWLGKDHWGKGNYE